MAVAVQHNALNMLPIQAAKPCKQIGFGVTNRTKNNEHNEQLKVSATLKIAIFPYLRFQRFQIDMLESFLLKKNQKKILFLSKDIGGKRFFLVNYLN